MIGIDRNTGAAVDDWLQFVQRATRALTTPVGTRQKRPLYGSLIPQLLGQNLGDDLLILAQSHAAKAFYNVENGIAEKLLKGEYRPAAIRAVEIPKPQGGKRMLGIPNAQDRHLPRT